ncbi:MAG TPA: VWA domain-containing protein, partial [Terrimicrobiaceae bacterium]
METSSLSFSQPAWFFALAIIPFVAALYFWSRRRRDALLSKVVAPRLRAQLAGAVSMGRRRLKLILILIVFGLIAVALARPQLGFVQREVKQRGRDVILAIDTSRSMLATDVAPNRLARAKLLSQDLLHLVRGDRIGLVAFAGSAFLQAPLTLDYNAVLSSLDELDTSVIPKGGTNIAEAIHVAEQAFGKGEGQTRAL